MKEGKRKKGREGWKEKKKNEAMNEKEKEGSWERRLKPIGSKLKLLQGNRFFSFFHVCLLFCS